MSHTVIKSALRGIRNKLINRIRRAGTPYSRTISVAVVLGIATGIGAQVIKWLIHYISHPVRLLTQHSKAALLLAPLIGIIIAGIYQRYVLKADIAHGVERIRRGLRAGQYNIPGRMTYAPILAGAVTLGFGGSGGSEEPSADMGAAMGSFIARHLGMGAKMARIMVSCGAGAAIAGIFKSPVGGMLFTLEVLQVELSLVEMMALAVSCVTSAVTAYILSDFSYDISFVQAVPFDPHTLPWTIGLGLGAGIYAVYYTRIMKYLRLYFEGISRQWCRWMLSGAMLSILIYELPILYGEGYDALAQLINGVSDVVTEGGASLPIGLHRLGMIGILVAIMLCKPIAAGASTSGGGVAGDFAPTLIAGAVYGFLFAIALDSLFGVRLPYSHFAFIGMASVMAAVVRAPLMAVFIAAEMADGYQFFPALLIASVTAYLTSKLLSNEAIKAAPPRLRP